MQNKKVAAALAAVQLYLQQEADEAASMLCEAAPPAFRDMTTEPGQWALSGRIDMMAGRRMIQLRAFTNAR
jgi:hypothetical protein